jgi:signal transduction histidine kinase
MVAVSGEAADLSGSVTLAALWAEVSHDLRQPVQALLLLTHSLSRASGDVGLRRTVEHMEKALLGLQDKLELLTKMSRLEAPELGLCSELHDRVMREMEAIAEQQGIGLRSPPGAWCGATPSSWQWCLEGLL